MQKKVELINEYVNLMSPLVYNGRMCMLIEGKPVRRKEQESLDEIVSIAKKFKMHRSFKKSLCGIHVVFGSGIDKCEYPIYQIYIDALSYDNYMHRMIIILVLLCIMLFLARYIIIKSNPHDF